MVGTCVATFCAGVSLREHAELTHKEKDDGRLARGDMLIAAAGGLVVSSGLLINFRF